MNELTENGNTGYETMPNPTEDARNEEIEDPIEMSVKSDEFDEINENDRELDLNYEIDDSDVIEMNFEPCNDNCSRCNKLIAIDVTASELGRWKNVETGLKSSVFGNSVFLESIFENFFFDIKDNLIPANLKSKYKAKFGVLFSKNKQDCLKHLNRILNALETESVDKAKRWNIIEDLFSRVIVNTLCNGLEDNFPFEYKISRMEHKLLQADTNEEIKNTLSSSNDKDGGGDDDDDDVTVLGTFSDDPVLNPCEESCSRCSMLLEKEVNVETFEKWKNVESSLRSECDGILEEIWKNILFKDANKNNNKCYSSNIKKTLLRKVNRAFGFIKLQNKRESLEFVDKVIDFLKKENDEKLLHAHILRRLCSKPLQDFVFIQQSDTYKLTIQKIKTAIEHYFLVEKLIKRYQNAIHVLNYEQRKEAPYHLENILKLLTLEKAEKSLQYHVIRSRFSKEFGLDDLLLPVANTYESNVDALRKHVLTKSGVNEISENKLLMNDVFSSLPKDAENQVVVTYLEEQLKQILRVINAELPDRSTKEYSKLLDLMFLHNVHPSMRTTFSRYYDASNINSRSIFDIAVSIATKKGVPLYSFIYGEFSYQLNHNGAAKTHVLDSVKRKTENESSSSAKRPKIVLYDESTSSKKRNEDQGTSSKKRNEDQGTSSKRSNEEHGSSSRKRNEQNETSSKKRDEDSGTNSKRRSSEKSSSSKKRTQCFKCKREGHMARDCPKMSCFECKREGHMAKDCPRIACFKCKREGHVAKYCNEVPHLNDVQSSNSRIASRLRDDRNRDDRNRDDRSHDRGRSWEDSYSHSSNNSQYGNRDSRNAKEVNVYRGVGQMLSGMQQDQRFSEPQLASSTRLGSHCWDDDIRTHGDFSGRQNMNMNNDEQNPRQNEFNSFMFNMFRTISENFGNQ